MQAHTHTYTHIHALIFGKICLRSLSCCCCSFTLRCASAAKPLFGARFDDMLMFVVVGRNGFTGNAAVVVVSVARKLIDALAVECLSQNWEYF